MSVENPNVIDYASIDKNGNAVLTISDHLEWNDDNEHIQILQKKINSYLAAIESGHFHSSYPDAKGRNIIINVVAKYIPNKEATIFFERVREALESAGYTFKYCFLKSE